MMSRKIALGGLFLAGACLIVSLLAGIAGWFWFFARPQPLPAKKQLYEGITYERIVRQSPRPMVIHVVTVDLRTDGIRFFVTPGDAEEALSLKASTTSQFLKKYDQQIAINGDAFEPWRSNSLLDYYPHVGDPVAPIGLAASQGTIYHQSFDDHPVLYISRNNQARFNTPIGQVYNALSGSQMVVEQGAVVSNLEEEPQPRTAVALDKPGKRLILVLVDGRQPNYSEGATLTELGEIIVEQGGYFGMNLDGGGSTTLVKAGRFGSADVLNSPIDHYFPGWERAVGNHLGIRVGNP